MVDERWTAGFTWFGGCVSDQPRYYRSPLTYRGLVSTQHPILQLFAASTHRKARLQTGRTKAAVTVGGPKILSLDEPYCATNSDMRRVLRVELDNNWKSWNELEAAIAAAGVQRPNLIIAHVHEVTKAVQHPHLIWLLKNPVCFTAAGNRKNIAAFNAVLRSLCHALRDLGADPGGLANSLKTKNPLCPLWNTKVCRETPYRSLAELREGLPWGVSKAQLFGGQQQPAAEPERHSNGLFAALRTKAFEIVPQHHPDALGAGSFDEFHHELAMYAYQIADRCRAKDEAARRTAAKVAVWTWEHFNAARWRSQRPRGRDRKFTAGLTPTAARQVAGRRTAAGRSQATLDRLLAAYRELTEDGSRPSQTAVSRASGVSLRTVKRHWADLVTNGAIDKKYHPARLCEQPHSKAATAPRDWSAPIRIQPTVPLDVKRPLPISSQTGHGGDSDPPVVFVSHEAQAATKTDLSGSECPW